jgi:hypothetical protein
MNQSGKSDIVEMIGQELFQWLSQTFSRKTTLREVPDDILERAQSIDITVRNYAADRNAITAIALITFAYRMANKVQHPKYGSNDLLLLKVLAKNEMRRRGGRSLSGNDMWGTPLYELITGEVGDKIRETKFMTNPM